MIISYRYNFIFIKTQKTAGTSLELCLSKFMGSDDIITPVAPPDEIIRKDIGGIGPQNYDDTSYLPLTKAIWRRLINSRNIFYSHMSLYQLNKLKIELSDFEIVTISRNPWEVNASLYFYEKNKRPEEVSDSFNNWLALNCIENFSKLRIGSAYYADTVLFYDNLSDDYEKWIKNTGLPQEAAQLLKKIKAKSGTRPKGLDYFSLYSDTSKELVETANRYEINQFQYKFQK